MRTVTMLTVTVLGVVTMLTVLGVVTMLTVLGVVTVLMHDRSTKDDQNA